MKPKNINHGSTNQGTEQATNEVNADLNESEESKPLDEFNPFDEIDLEEEVFDSINPFGNDNDITQEINFPSDSEKTSNHIESKKELNRKENPIHEGESESKPSSNIELVVDPDTSYFFVFGATTAGKTAMMSGLSYYMKAISDGQLRTCSDETLTNHRTGEYVLQDMTRRVKKGEFVAGTGRLEKTDNVFPTEINLEYIPQDSNKYSMPFCILEMAGEDLQELNITDGGKGGGKLDERISAYLHHPNCSMAFICVVDSDKPNESEELIERFINYTHKIGREENPILISVNKWDKVKDNYNNDVNEYFKKEIPILNKITRDPDREYSKMGFSIGKTDDSDSYYKYDHSDSEKLFKWMYECATGTSIDEVQPKSFFSKLFNSK